MVHGISEELLHSQVIWLRIILKVKKGHTLNLAEILTRRTSLPVKLHDESTFWGIIIFTRNCKMLLFEHDVVQKVNIKLVREYLCKIMKRYWQFLQSYRFHKVVWPWASLKVQKGHTKINIQLICDFDVENTTINLQLDTVNLWRVITFTRSSQMMLAWKFKKVTQRSRSNLVEILMSRTSLPA